MQMKMNKSSPVAEGILNISRVGGKDSSDFFRKWKSNGSPFR
jgi:hypothetical protein